MKIEEITWRIRGTRPLMQNKFHESTADQNGSPDDKEGKPKRKRVTKRSPEEEGKVTVDPITKTGRPVTPLQSARLKLHEVDLGGGKKGYGHPSVAFWGALCDATPNVEFTGSAGQKKMRASSTVPYYVQVCGEYFMLCDPGTLEDRKPRLLTDKDWLVDRRWIQGSRGLIIAHRPKFREWGGLLTFEVDREVFEGPQGLNVLTELLNKAGRMGVGSGRQHYVKPSGGKARWCTLNMGKYWATLA